MSHLSFWDDLSLNRVFLAILCAILLLTGTVIWRGGIDAPVALPSDAVSNYPMGIAIECAGRRLFRSGHAVLLPSIRSAREAVLRALPVPGLAPADGGGHDLSSSHQCPGTSSQTGQIIYSVSPIAGIATSSMGASNESMATAMKGAAITPALMYAFIFNSLLIAARRRLHREFLARADVMDSAAAVKVESPDFDQA